MSKSKLMGRLLQSTILVGAVAGAAPAFAQTDEGDTIVVTGTLIRRSDIEAPSPVASVSAAELKVVNTVNTEDFLNTLPQVIPGLDGSSNNPGNGVATANLRGLGSARTLVLVEGRRFVPFDGNGVVDLNQIPAALVERTDVVTGGASALYGSDAMAGVINFALRDEFEGLEIDSSYERTEQDDGEIFQVSAIGGGDFADGLGNATFFAAYTDRQSVFQGDRDFSAVANDDTEVGTPFNPFGSSGIPGTRIFDSFDFSDLDDYSVGANGCVGANGASTEGLNENCIGGATFNRDGDPIPFINAGPNTSRYNYAPVNYLQLPQERYNLAGFVTYQIAENTELKLRGMYANNVVAQELAPTPYFAPLSIALSNGTLTDDTRTVFTANSQGVYDAALADLADADPDNDAAAVAARDGVDTDGDGVVDTYNVGFIGRRMLEIGPRNSTRDQSATQWTAETTTDLSNGMIWTNFAQFARSNGAQAQTGNVSVSAFNDAVENETCNIFGPNNLSDDCVQAISRTGIIRESYEQTILGSQLSGDLFGITVPTAQNAVAFAAGVEYRDEAANFQPDSVLGPDVRGFNQSAPISGRFDVTEVFAEVAVPLVEGVAGVEELSLNGAFRYSDYSTVGELETYQIGAAYAPVPGYTFKVSYNKAARAPNIADLFSPVTNNFPGAFDPCAADGDGDPQGGVQAICLREGVPASAFETSALQPNTQTEALSGGNPDLSEETAETFTAGLVAQPDFLDGLTIKLDYYDIEIDDVIATAPIQTVLNGCYIEDVQSFCNLVSRTASGQIDFVSLNSQNLAFLGAEGIDLDTDYSFDTGEYGTFGVRFIGTYRLGSETQTLVTNPVYDCAGNFGGQLGVCGEPEPEWKHTAFLNWGMGDLNATLRWRYIGEVNADDELAIGDGIDGNEVEPIGTLRGQEIDAYNYFDLSANYALSETLTIRGGVRNLLDEEPPIQGDSYQEQANTWPATYDALGRRYFVGLTASF